MNIWFLPPEPKPEKNNVEKKAGDITKVSTVKKEKITTTSSKKSSVKSTKKTVAKKSVKKAELK